MREGRDMAKKLKLRSARHFAASPELRRFCCGRNGRSIFRPRNEGECLLFARLVDGIFGIVRAYARRKTALVLAGIGRC